MPAPDGDGWHAQVVASGGLDVLTWPAFADLGLDAVVTTRHGGVSSGPYESLNLGMFVGDDLDLVIENRRRAVGAVDAELDDVVVGEQTHSTTASVVGLDDRGRGAGTPEGAVPGTDALVTDAPGIVLMILTADCTPMVLFDPRARVLACVHAGWRGTTGGIVSATLAVMARLGAHVPDVVAAIGPA